MLENSTGSTIGVVVLAGGKSARMGRPKAWLPWGDEPLLTRVVRRMAPLGPLVVVAAGGQPLPPLTAGSVVRDRTPDQGPLQGLARGLEALGHTEWAFVVTTDAPFVTPALATALQRHGADADAVIPTVESRPQPLIALYRPHLAATAQALLDAGERRARALGEAVPCRRPAPEELDAPDAALQGFVTVNTPDAYADALRLWTGD